MDERTFSRKFCFEHESGAVLYPIRMRNLDSGRVAFRVYRKGNLKEQSREVEEDEIVPLVLEQNHSIRMSTLDRRRHGAYKPTGRSIVNVMRIK